MTRLAALAFAVCALGCDGATRQSATDSCREMCAPREVKQFEMKAFGGICECAADPCGAAGDDPRPQGRAGSACAPSPSGLPYTQPREGLPASASDDRDGTGVPAAPSLHTRALAAQAQAREMGLIEDLDAEVEW